MAGAEPSSEATGGAAGADPRAISSPLEIELAHARLMRRLFGDDATHVTVGRFVVHECLGVGAMGHVHAAFDPTLDRRVAIKLVRFPEPQATAQARERLLEEARAMAKLSHPNILTVFDAGERGAEVFVAMEYAAGGTLREWSGNVARREVLRACLDAGAGLAAAHAAGILHRDFKPDNVLLTADDRVKVGDFGFAVRLEGRHEQPGVGTPAYMAPEVRRGHPHSPESDQFAFAASTWELVFGRRPRQAEEPLPPTATSWARARRVGNVLRRGLSPRPEDRFPTIQALLVELSAAANPSRRRTWLGAAVAGVVAAAAMGVVWSSSGPDPTGRDDPGGVPDPCAAGRERMDDVWSEEAKRSIQAKLHSLPSTLVPQFDAHAEAWTAAHRSACEATHVRREQSEAMLDLRMECLGQRLDEFDALIGQVELAEEPARLAGVVQRLPRLAMCDDLERLRARAAAPPEADKEPAVRELQRTLGQLRARWLAGERETVRAEIPGLVRGAEATEWAPLIAEVAYFAGRAGPYDREEQVELFHRAASAAATGGDDRRVAAAWGELITVVGYNQGRHEEALRMRPFAEAALARTGGDAVLEAKILNATSIVLDELGRHEEASTGFRKVVVLRESALGPEHISVAAALNNLGDSQRLAGDLEGARETLTRGLAIKRAVLGPSHPDLAYTSENLASVLVELGAFDAAEAEARRAMKLYEGNEERSPGVAITLGEVALARGNRPEAIARYREAEAAWSGSGEGIEHVEAIVRLAGLEQAEGEETRAAERLRALERRVEGLDPSGRLTKVRCAARALCRTLGDAEGASRWGDGVTCPEE